MEKKLIVEGMMCNHCKASVEKALSNVEGVSNVNVDLAGKLATVICDDTVTDADLYAAVEKKGFTPKPLA